MDKLTTPIHNLSIAKGLVASAVIMTLSSNALAQVRQSHQCLRDGTTRLVQLNTTSDSGVPCEVAYLKPTEGLPDASLWRAMHDADFCRQKYDAFIVKLESKLGWACESTDPAQQRVAAPKVNDDALPVTAQAQSSLDITTKAEPVLPRSAKLEAQRKAEADALVAAELEARRKAEADALAAAELEARRQAEADALAVAELEARRKAEADALAAAELEAQRKAEADALAVAELEAQRKIEEDKLALATLAAAKPSALLENQQPLDPLQDQPASQAAIDTQRAERARLALNTAPSAALPKATRGPDAPEKFGLELMRTQFPTGHYQASPDFPHTGDQFLCPADGFFIWNTQNSDTPVFEMGRNLSFAFNLSLFAGVARAITISDTNAEQCSYDFHSSYCMDDQLIGGLKNTSATARSLNCGAESGNTDSARPLTLISQLSSSDLPDACLASAPPAVMGLARFATSSTDLEQTGLELAIERYNGSSVTKANCRYLPRR